MNSGRVLITGAAGFLGSAIVDLAAKSGLAVIATDRAIRNQPPHVCFVQADVLDPTSLPKIFNGVDCVCHVAGLAHVFDKAEVLRAHFHAVNVTGTNNVARAAVRAGINHFIFVSSVSVYGGEARGKNEDSPCQPEGSYAKSKFDAERCLIDLCQKERMNLTILRLTTLYGEGDAGNVARLIGIINRQRFIWVGKGKNLKSLLHRKDAARACIAAINKTATGINIYNVSAPPVRMSDIVEAIFVASGKAVSAWHIPASLGLISAMILKKLSFNQGPLANIHGTLQKWLADDYYNIDKFCETFNYQTK